MKPVVIVAAVVLVGCDGDPSTAPDAGKEIDAAVPAGPCWPEVTHVPQGSAILGTGRNGFETMPSVLPLEYGTQDGYMLIANVRMTGFAPGNPQNVFEPTNPRTRIRAFFDDTDIPLNSFAKCPFRYGYTPTGGGEYEIGEATPIIFETCWRGEHLFGKQIRVELELMDDAGGYTTDVKIVTAAPPTGFYPDEPPGQPGCVTPP